MLAPLTGVIAEQLALGISVAFLADVIATPALITEAMRLLPQRRMASLEGGSLSVEGRGGSSA